MELGLPSAFRNYRTSSVIRDRDRQPRHHYPPYPTLRKFSAPTLWVATSMLRAPLPCRVGHAPRAIQALSLFPLVEAADLREPRASTRVASCQHLTLRPFHTVMLAPTKFVVAEG
jgi:hypothetical protein